jgi:hypothetical protein
MIKDPSVNLHEVDIHLAIMKTDHHPGFFVSTDFTAILASY